MISFTSKRENKKNPSVSSRAGVSLDYKNKVKNTHIHKNDKNKLVKLLWGGDLIGFLKRDQR